MPQDAPADFEGVITMTLFRNAVITNARLDREGEHERACGSSGRAAGT